MTIGPQRAHSASVSEMREYKCILCGIDLDPDEFGHPDDADLCGHCVAPRIAREKRVAQFSSETWAYRDQVTRAVVRIYRDCADRDGDGASKKLWEKVLRVLES